MHLAQLNIGTKPVGKSALDDIITRAICLFWGLEVEASGESGPMGPLLGQQYSRSS